MNDTTIITIKKQRKYATNQDRLGLNVPFVFLDIIQML